MLVKLTNEGVRTLQCVEPWAMLKKAFFQTGAFVLSLVNRLPYCACNKRQNKRVPQLSNAITLSDLSTSVQWTGEKGHAVNV